MPLARRYSTTGSPSRRQPSGLPATSSSDYAATYQALCTNCAPAPFRFVLVTGSLAHAGWRAAAGLASSSSFVLRLKPLIENVPRGEQTLVRMDGRVRMQVLERKIRDDRCRAPLLHRENIAVLGDDLVVLAQELRDRGLVAESRA